VNVLVIEPGHGSLWLSDAKYVRRDGVLSPRGRYVRGTNWYHDGGPYLPDGGINIPETLTYPRRLILKVEP
jgi:hypothetical protein